MFRILGALLCVVFMTCLASCSSDSGDMNPAVPAGKTGVAQENARQLWGLWEFTANPDAATLDAVPMRNGSMHLNALLFLEPPALVYLTLESVQFNGNIIEADIGLQHPFLGLTKFTGFDVCGSLITGGSITGFTDTELIMAGDGDTRLLNADGYTRWWNPAEFPVNTGTMFSYIDGLLGAPDSIADYNSTLNGYKYFADGLGPDDTLDTVVLANRGLFTAGQKNVRHYSIEMGAGGLVFNYAVDANWAFPTGEHPYEAPGDFGPGANRVEAWRVNITEIENTLGYDGDFGGGHLLMEVDVYDWFDADFNTVSAESLSEIDQVTTGTPVSTGDGYATYELDLSGDDLTQDGNIDLLITVASDVTGYQGLLPGKTVSAYFIHETNVADLLPGDCPTGIHSEFFGEGEFMPSGNYNIPPHDAAILTSGLYTKEFLICGNGFAGSGVAGFDISTLGPSEPHGFIGLIGVGAPSSMDVSVNYDNIFIVMPYPVDNYDEIDVYRTDGTPVQTIYSPHGGAVVALDVTPTEELWFIELVGNTHYLHHATAIAEWTWNIIDADSQTILTDLVTVPHVFDLIYEPATDRVFVYHADLNGSITGYDASGTGPPAELTAISKTQIWSAEGPLNYIAETAYNTGADIELDLVDGTLSNCRITIFANFTTGGTSIKKFDADLNTLNTAALTGGPFSTFAIAVEPLLNMRRLVFLPLTDFDDDYYLYSPPTNW